MQPFERNPRFTNPLSRSDSPYLRQHAHNPVFWYPWGKEAIERARAENKPILLSIGYSTCYWCHVMEREVFENVSIAALMNRVCINIKVDREEHPQIDEIYMVARQMLTQEGGWPNNVFLTPDLKPFHAGGTYAPDEAYGKPGFPRLLEWLDYVWTTKEQEVRDTADKIVGDMAQYLTHKTPANPVETTIPAQSRHLFSVLDHYYDERAGGFFQSPKFPHECYLEFLLGCYEMQDSHRALDMVTRSLGRMSAGGLYDQVGCGFHRYAVDKEWYVPHFEKMLYNQAQLARLYTEAARLTGNACFADIARSTLEFVSGPLTSGNGAFYAGIDAETDGVEGEYYAWKAEDLKQLLTPEELTFFTAFYALADIPAFPGHKHVDGQVLIARKPLDVAAREHNMPYVQLAAFSGEILNKLLSQRNTRKAPRLDDKIITSWNGLMIEAFALAGVVLNQPKYIERAQAAADFILEHSINNEGRLCRIFAGGHAQHDALLEDYACLVKGLIALHRATRSPAMLTAATDLMARAKELFGGDNGSYFLTEPNADLLFRIQSADDSAIPGACAVMLHNLVDLFLITADNAWREQARALSAFFLQGNAAPSVEYASFLHASLRLATLDHTDKRNLPASFSELNAPEHRQAPDEIVTAAAQLVPAGAKPGEACELHVTLHIKEGWHINAPTPLQPYLIPTQIDVQGAELQEIIYPDPEIRPSLDSASAGQKLLVYEGSTRIRVRLTLPQAASRAPLKIQLRFQPCRETTCHTTRDLALTI